MPMSTCAACGTLHQAAACACPHCGQTLKVCGSRTLATAAAFAMGLAVAGCGDKDSDDSGTTPQPEYGVADTGGTGD